MILWLLGGMWLIGAAICIPLFFDRDDPWGVAFALLWPLLVLAALAGMFLGACRVVHAFLFNDTPPEDL
jgi:hypothetical protein